MKLQDLYEKKGGTAWVILYTPDKLILGKRAPGINNSNQWNFFGGHIDANESAAEAAARELKEEINITVDAAHLKQVAVIGDATYFAYKVSGKVGNTTDEVSAIRAFKLTELPDNMHSKTENFFSRIDTFFE